MQAPGALRLCSVKLTHSSEATLLFNIPPSRCLELCKTALLSLAGECSTREAEDGHISVPPKIIPAPPAELPAEVVGRLKFPEEGIKAVHKVWDEFVAANPEING